MNKCSEDIKDKFMDFVFSILVNNHELDENDVKILKDMLKHKISTNSISFLEYQCLFTSPSFLNTIFYLRFANISRNMNYLNSITDEQLMHINVKHINQILKVLHVEHEDELSNVYSYAIKLYLVFGLERTLAILRGSYGTLDRTFYDNLSRVDTKGVVLVKEGSKYLPKINEDFINFMFANKQNNHFMEMLNDPNSLLSKNWSYLYNNIDELQERCHGVLTLKKLNIIFKQLSPTRDIKDVSPDNYKLTENNILNDVCLGNKTGRSNEEIYKNLLDIYDKMKKRRESSIPYLEGKASNGYSFKMMKLNDPIIFTLGYKGNCCIRVKDIAHNHLLHAALCRNGRILLINDESNELAGFVPLKRNGEVLIANSIECLHKKRNDDAIKTFEEAVFKIVDATKGDEPIRLVCIGTEAYARPEGKDFPENIEVPTIYEKDDSVYKHTDCYHKELTIVYQDPKLKLENIKYGNPNVSYQDPRNKIESCDFSTSSDEIRVKALNVINAVRYANADIEELENFHKCGRYGIKSCIFNDDWYIVITYDDNIYGDYLKHDQRAEKEYNLALCEILNVKERELESEIPLIKKFR